MAIEITWVPIEHDAYMAIYVAVGGPGGLLRAHETASYDDYWLTVWGLRGSDAPLIRAIRRGTRDEGTWEYAIAVVKEVRDGQA